MILLGSPYSLQVRGIGFVVFPNKNLIKMKRFYTPADRKKNLKELYRIESVGDYVNLIQKLKIDFPSLKNLDTVHEDYAHVNNYITNLITQSKRICFLCVYDLTKEAYYLNKFPDKEIIVGDVSTVAIKNAEHFWPNVKVIQTTLQDYVCDQEDLIIINHAEYFLNPQELSKFLLNGRNIVLNNVQLYQPKQLNWLHYMVRSTKVSAKNLISVFGANSQMQFRGWFYSIQDYIQASHGTDKFLRTVIFRFQRSSAFGKSIPNNKFYDMYSASIIYESIN